MKREIDILRYSDSYDSLDMFPITDTTFFNTLSD